MITQHTYNMKNIFKKIIFTSLVIFLYIISFNTADAAITLINTSTAGSFNTTDIVVNKPTNTAQNDFILAEIFTYKKTVTAPDGWNFIRGNENTNYGNFYMYYKVAGASEPSNYTWVVSSSTSTGPNGALLATFRGGFNTSNPIDQSNSSLAATLGTAFSAGAITVSAANSSLIFLGGGDPANDSYTFTKPSVPTTDWAEIYESVVVTSQHKATIDTMTWTSSGSTGTVQANSSGNFNPRFSFVLSLNPAPVGPANLKTWNGLAKASIKSMFGLAIASVKSWVGIQ